MLRKLFVRVVLLVAFASVVYYLGNGIFGAAADRWYGGAMVFMIIAVNLLTPALLVASMTGPRSERLDRERKVFERLGRPDLAEGAELQREWTDANDPMSHPLYHSNTGIPVLVSRIADTQSSVRNHPLVRLTVKGETQGEFEVVAVAPRIAVPRAGDIVRVITHPADPTRYRYAGPMEP